MILITTMTVALLEIVPIIITMTVTLGTINTDIVKRSVTSMVKMDCDTGILIFQL